MYASLLPFFGFLYSFQIKKYSADMVFQFQLIWCIQEHMVFLIFFKKETH
jgi:hypothetical protein